MDSDKKEQHSKKPVAKPAKALTIETIMAELKTEERYTNYFKNFQPASVKTFIDFYSMNKESWTLFGYSCLQEMDAEDMRWINVAEKHLKIIQQQKLFEEQCRWRAEEVTFAEVQISFDFKVWEQNVLYCPFIAPVNDDDIALYIQYMQQEDVAFDMESFYAWQDYHEIKEAYNNYEPDENYSDWYSFAAAQRGTTALMELPDIRGEKEEYYTNLYLTKKKEENAESTKTTAAPPDGRPVLDYFNDKQLEDAVKTLEDKEMQQYFKAYTHCNRHRDVEEELVEIIKVLLSADELVPVQGHTDMKEALRWAYLQYSAKKNSRVSPLCV